MKKFKVTLQAEITVEFDEKSDEFREMWNNYKEHFDNDVDYETFAENIAQFIGRYGTKELFEGVGYVMLNGQPQSIWADGAYIKGESPVSLSGFDTDINDMVYYEVYYTQDLSDEDCEESEE